jgi:hypothetical protein
MSNTGGSTPLPRMTRLRIWWWKVRYALRFHKRGRDEDGSRLAWAFCMDSAEQAWGWATDRVYGDPVEVALNRDPVEDADEELSNWETA